MEREGQQWHEMEDCSTDERLQQENALSLTVDRRVRRTSRDVDEAQRSRRLASASAGRRSSSHRNVDARPFWHLYAKTAHELF